MLNIIVGFAVGVLVGKLGLAAILTYLKAKYAAIASKK
jgi:hypothetical protein